MARFRVAFDEAFRESYGDLEEATERSAEIAATGRIVWLARGYIRPRLIAVFPDDQAVEAERRWNERDGGPRKSPWAYVKEAALELLSP